MTRKQFNEYVRLTRIYHRDGNDASYRKLREYERDLQKKRASQFDDLDLISEIAAYSVYKKDVTYEMMREAYLILGNEFDKEEEDAVSNTEQATNEIGD